MTFEQQKKREEKNTKHFAGGERCHRGRLRDRWVFESW